jgi:hypothetical protein
MERVLCKETNKQVSLIHQGFDIAIIKRDSSESQECVNIVTLAVNRRTRPRDIFGYKPSLKKRQNFF